QIKLLIALTHGGMNTLRNAIILRGVRSATIDDVSREGREETLILFALETNEG
ncbi:hypothetical protein ACJX0J_019332, partial [Zea mays]